MKIPSNIANSYCFVQANGIEIMMCEYKKNRMICWAPRHLIALHSFATD